MQTDGFVTADKVKNAYLGLGVKQDTFLTLFAKFVADMLLVADLDILLILYQFFQCMEKFSWPV